MIAGLFAYYLNSKNEHEALSQFENQSLNIMRSYKVGNMQKLCDIDT